MQAGESREDGTYWSVWAADVPALGYRTYRLASSSTMASHVTPMPEDTVATAGARSARGMVAGDFYEVEVDTARGGIVRLVDRESGRNLVDADGPWTLGQFIHERLGNRHQLEAFRLDAVERHGWEGLAVEGVDDGPCWRSLRLRARVPGCVDASGVTWEIRLYKTAKRIELRYAMRKLPVRDPVAVYIAFPFAPAGATLAWESQGGVVRPGRDQLPGSASDWVGVQGFVAARDQAGQIVLCSVEVPLVQLGGLNLGQFARVAAPAAPHVFSWVLNNYWTTNFQASQGGELRWRYLLTSSSDASDSLATKTGLEARVPLAGRVGLVHGLRWNQAGAAPRPGAGAKG
jgi:alpha-mannosidase